MKCGFVVVFVSGLNIYGIAFAKIREAFKEDYALWFLLFK